MKPLRGMVIAILAVSLAGPVVAGNSISVRLVKASNGAAHVDASLADVVPAFQKNLVFKSYTLEASGKLALPADATLSLGPYQVKCAGPQERLSIIVNHGRSPLINTTTTLIDGKPLVLGGFPARDGRYIFVFLSR